MQLLQMRDAIIIVRIEGAFKLVMTIFIYSLNLTIKFQELAISLSV